MVATGLVEPSILTSLLNAPVSVGLVTTEVFPAISVTTAETSAPFLNSLSFIQKPDRIVSARFIYKISTFRLVLKLVYFSIHSLQVKLQ